MEPSNVLLGNRPTIDAPPTAGGRARGPIPWATIAVGLVVLVGLAVGFQSAWALVIGFSIAIPLERAFRRHDQPIVRPGLRTDVVHFLFTHFLEGAAIIGAALICWIPLHLLVIEPAQAWLAQQRPVVIALLGMVLFDFLYYWQHRLAHEWGFLWRFHEVHHSSERLDWIAASRLHPFEAFIGGFVVAPAFIVLGFPVGYLGLFSGITTIWAVLIHANVNWRLRWLDRLYPTPEYHHWHHSNEPDARNRNYGLPLWDTLFGTYYMPDERRPAHYGVDAPMPDGWFAQLAHPLRRRPPGSVPS